MRHAWSDAVNAVVCDVLYHGSTPSRICFDNACTAGKIFFGSERLSSPDFLEVSHRARRARWNVLDIFEGVHRMSPRKVNATRRHGCHATAAVRHLNKHRRTQKKPSSRKFRGRRLEGATVGDFGRGLDVPPVFERWLGSFFWLVVWLVFQSFAGGSFGVIDSGGGPADRIGVRCRWVEARWLQPLWCETLWHDALSVAVPTSENGVSISTARWNCCGSCRASRS